MRSRVTIQNQRKKDAQNKKDDIILQQKTVSITTFASTFDFPEALEKTPYMDYILNRENILICIFYNGKSLIINSFNARIVKH